MKNKRPSLKDIAAELKVSVTTVSFVLNGKGKEKGISDAVSEKIHKYVEEINYKPNQLARSLRTGKSGVIVFMVEDISNTFFARIARLIEDIAYQRGYRILFCSSENDDRKSEELIDLFLERQVDGFIVIPSPGIQGKLEKLIRENIPVVLFDRYFPGLNSSYVVINNEESAYKATRHLLGNGFRDIAFITIESEQPQMQDRLNGYRKAIKEKNENLFQNNYILNKIDKKEFMTTETFGFGLHFNPLSMEPFTIGTVKKFNVPYDGKIWLIEAVEETKS